MSKREYKIHEELFGNHDMGALEEFVSVCGSSATRSKMQKWSKAYRNVAAAEQESEDGWIVTITPPRNVQKHLDTAIPNEKTKIAAKKSATDDDDDDDDVSSDHLIISQRKNSR